MLADTIARMIEKMLDERGGVIELQRNDFANQIGCVPSQVSYVITSRFTPQNGYIIESRRGGGGYIRIIKKEIHRDEYLMHFYCAIGDSIEEKDAYTFIQNLFGTGLITDREARLLMGVMSNTALQKLDNATRASLRATMFKQIVLTLIH
ncbi:MAG: CtsR family transcriptional regulator [Clostridia bacterium]|nr:CtsR family transcriptional regulator [Clostridia bacterium]